jgi:hypothetical protein
MWFFRAYSYGFQQVFKAVFSRAKGQEHPHHFAAFLFKSNTAKIDPAQMPHNMELVYPVLPFKEKYIIYDGHVWSVCSGTAQRRLHLQHRSAAAARSGQPRCRAADVAQVFRKEMTNPDQVGERTVVEYEGLKVYLIRV